MNSKVTKLLLILILLLAFGLRFYKIAEIPKSLTWDEAAVGYNAWTIANYGKDEYGKPFPLYFQSFGEDKQPVHIYITAFFVKILGLSEFSTRFPAAVFGVLNVLLIFFVSKNLLNRNIGLIASFLLAISPQNIFFSRFNHEANIALFFFMLGLLLFFKGLKKINFLLPLSIISFCFSMITYHAAEIFVPPVLLVLIILYFNQIRQKIYILLICLIIVISFVVFGILQPRLFGVTRFDQTKQGNSDVEKTQIFKQTKNYTLGRIELVSTQYFWHFDPNYLFIQGGKNPRLSPQNSGEFYMIEALFLILGFVYLFVKRSKKTVFILAWVLLGPLPSSLVAEAPHVGRAAFMMGGWDIMAGFGLYSFITYFKNKKIKWTMVVVVIGLLFLSLGIFFKNYLYEFPKRYSIDWQYGMKQIVSYVKDHPEYTEVFMTNVRAQPYIFFLYYLQTPLPEYLNTVYYNNSESQSYSNVSFFDRYYFEGWDPIESFPNKGVLYIVSPSQYDGLRHKKSFDVKEKILYPNGLDAFYIISAK